LLSLIYYKVQNFLTGYALLYAPTTERSEFKKYFSVIFILIGFLFFIDIIRLELIFSFYQF